MKIEIQRTDERGTAEHDWLHTRFSFSFADYHNPNKMGFGKLRVLNDDFIDPAKGFGAHPHDNMEIVSIVLEGELKHTDNMGNEGVIPSGDVQRMSAGTGVIHSEFNRSMEKKVHLLQIWIFPKEKNITPSYEQKSFSGEDKKNKILTVVSGYKKKGALYIHQEAELLLGELDKNISVKHKLENEEHGVYVFVIDGKIKVGGTKLEKGDAAEIIEIKELEITALEESKVLVIEVPLD